MNVFILNKEFQQIKIVDYYTSFIWTVRFLDSGDFEMQSPVNSEFIKDLEVGNYIFCDAFYKDGKAPLMIIETIEIQKKDNSDFITINGRDLKSILDRRIIWGLTTFNSGEYLHNVIQNLFVNNISNPPDWSKKYVFGPDYEEEIKIQGIYRKINNFIIEDGSTLYENVQIDEDKQYNGENIYDVFRDLLHAYGFGLDVLYDFNNARLTLMILDKKDHSTYQSINTPLIFSSNFDNLKDGKYLFSTTNEKNTALLIGQKYEEDDQYNVMYNFIENDISGLDRKETFIDVSSIARIDEETQQEYGNRKYMAMLKDKGIEELSKMTIVNKYDGVINEIAGYQYLEDYNIGDICEIYDDFGKSNIVYISEVVMSVSNNGQTIIPTFSSLDEEN